MYDHFEKLKSNLELDPAFADSISTRHNAIRAYLQNNLPLFKDSKLIGSLQRKTRIHPGPNKKFDIDIMVVMGEFHGWVGTGGVSPQRALNALHATVTDSTRYGNMNPVQDPPTVTLTYSDNIEVQLVPAYIDMIGHDPSGNILGPKGRGYWIVKNGQWEMADYDHEAEYISEKNKDSAGHLVPTIKVLKAIKREYFPELDSFPLEIIAADTVPVSVIVKQVHKEPIYTHDLILEFFDDARSRLANPIQIPGSKSPAIHLNPGVATTLDKRFQIIADHIRWANQLSTQGDQIEAWRKLCGDYFPVRIN